MMVLSARLDYPWDHLVGADGVIEWVIQPIGQGVRIWSRNLYCVKTLDISFLMRLSIVFEVVLWSWVIARLSCTMLALAYYFTTKMRLVVVLLSVFAVNLLECDDLSIGSGYMAYYMCIYIYIYAFWSPPKTRWPRNLPRKKNTWIEENDENTSRKRQCKNLTEK